jgi:hypothetical protein
MSRKSFLEFLVAARDRTATRTRYQRRNLAQLLFHARNEGFDFAAGDVSSVAGALEANVILRLDADPFDGTSRLWRQMWGAYHLEYLVEHVVRRHTDAELWSVLNDDGAGAPASEAPAVSRPPDPPPDHRVLGFLRLVAARADLLDSLKPRGKQVVLAAAADFGFPFTETEFDTYVWDLEVALAARRGEQFDAHFPLWQTMWGTYYLEYLVTDLLPSLEETGLVGTDRLERGQ